MSVEKNKGKLGFQNLHGFNLEMLSKHVWNFIRNLTSLVARVSKAKYYPDNNLLITTFYKLQVREAIVSFGRVYMQLKKHYVRILDGW